MVKHIYLVRHGETAGNRSWVHQKLSTPLNALGHAEAEATARSLAALPVDTLIASDAVRAQETAVHIARATRLEPRALPVFRELRRAKSIEGRHIFSPTALVSALLFYVHSGTRAWRQDDGENLLEFRDRTRRALTLLAEERGEHIVVVSHREFINGMIFDVEHDFTGSMVRFLFATEFSKLRNGSVTHLTYDPARAPSWRVEHAKDARHQYFPTRR